MCEQNVYVVPKRANKNGQKISGVSFIKRANKFTEMAVLLCSIVPVIGPRIVLLCLGVALQASLPWLEGQRYRLWHACTFRRCADRSLGEFRPVAGVVGTEI